MKFAESVVTLCGQLPHTMAAQRIAGQLHDAGTSVGANYRASCCARSRREFISKISQAYEEADECGYWLDLLVTSRIVSSERVADLRTEADELSRILAASRRTAQRHERHRNDPAHAINNRQSVNRR